MPIEQEKASRPGLVGVNSISVTPVSGSIFEIFNDGIVNARAQLKTLSVMSFNLTGTPAFKVSEILSELADDHTNQVKKPLILSIFMS